MVVVIDLGEIGELPGREAWGWAQETAIARLLRQALEARRQARLVIGAERPYLYAGSVAQLNFVHSAQATEPYPPNRLASLCSLPAAGWATIPTPIHLHTG